MDLPALWTIPFLHMNDSPTGNQVPVGKGMDLPVRTAGWHGQRAGL